MNKIYALCIVIALTVSCLLVENAVASTTKPSVPEFTLKYVIGSFDVAPTYTTDPYTGKSVIYSEGRHVQNNTLQITIKNQPFTSQLDSSGNYTSLYYAVAFKGHYEEKWEYMPYNAMEKGSSSDGAMTTMRGGSYIKASSEDYTVIALSNWQSGNIPDDSQIDIMVQALIGHDNTVNWGRSFIGGGDWVTYYFEGESSDWSNTKTITIGSGEVTTEPTALPTQNPVVPTQTATAQPTQNPTTTPTEPETQIGKLLGFDWEMVAIALLVVAVALLAVGLLVVWRRLGSIKGSTVA